MQFTVLASGSSGNASLVRVGQFGVLLDVGLGPQRMADRLLSSGSSWQEVNAVILSHVHADHWKERSLRFLRQNRIPLYCHVEHDADMTRLSSAFQVLRKNHLLHFYRCEEWVALDSGLRFRALPLSHDSGTTCGFRLECPAGSVGYATDLGVWEPDLADALADVDILAVEFNHDVAMEKGSGRDPVLIARVLGEMGHLSNEQAASLVREVLLRSQPGSVRHLVQLHLSRQCNQPSLARAAAQRVLAELGVQLTIHTAQQEQAGPMLRISGEPAATVIGGKMLRTEPALYYQPMLPGWED